MSRHLIALLACLSAALPLAAQKSTRQFDFWIGEWNVQNRHMQPDGSWIDGTRTRARITPVCRGNAILEEWAGPFRGSFMNGFSLRSWNPAQEHWDLVLLWTANGIGSFGRLSGRFRHGRGEFLSGSQGPNRTRYTFSDGLPDTVRWDSSTSADAGVHWKTDWIMEFTRTRAADEVTQDRLFGVDWNAGRIAPAPEARVLDWMLGSWSGTASSADGAERQARLRCRLLNKDCMILDVLETRAASEEAWDERLAVRSWIGQRKAWESWRVTSGDSRLVQALGGSDDVAFVSTWLDPVSGQEHQEALIHADEDLLIIEESVRAANSGEADWVVQQTVALQRAPR